MLLQQVLLESPWVRLVLSGHDHIGGYSQQGHVHFVTVEAMLEGGLACAFAGGQLHCYCCPFCSTVYLI